MGTSTESDDETDEARLDFAADSKDPPQPVSRPLAARVSLNALSRAWRAQLRLGSDDGEARQARRLTSEALVQT